MNISFPTIKWDFNLPHRECCKKYKYKYILALANLAQSLEHQPTD